jgi:uncharacterized protein
VAAITSINALRERYRRPPVERAIRKELDRIDGHARRFIAHSPFFVLATSSVDGRLDASPRGDRPGFVHVRDETTLLVPDRPGNNRLDSLTNLIERPGAGLLFMIPGVDETLRVNGKIEIRDDDDLRAAFAVSGRLPTTVLVVSVEQVYLHCAKAFMRSGLWNPHSWHASRPVPTLGEMIHDQTNVPLETQDAMLARYRESLY